MLKFTLKTLYTINSHLEKGKVTWKPFSAKGNICIQSTVTAQLQNTLISGHCNMQTSKPEQCTVVVGVFKSRAYHHCGALVEWMAPGLESLWRCWSPHRCSCQHQRAPLWRCTDSPSPVRWSDDCPGSQKLGTRWKSKKMSDLWIKKRNNLNKTPKMLFAFCFVEGVIKQGGRNGDALLVWCVL